MSGNSDHILVNHAALDQAANELANAVKQTGAILDDLEAKLKPLADNWKGEAKQAYDIAINKWNQSMAHLQTIASEAGTTVASANTDYADVDKKAASFFQ